MEDRFLNHIWLFKNDCLGAICQHAWHSLYGIEKLLALLDIVWLATTTLYSFLLVKETHMPMHSMDLYTVSYLTSLVQAQGTRLRMASETDHQNPVVWPEAAWVACSKLSSFSVITPYSCPPIPCTSPNTTHSGNIRLTIISRLNLVLLLQALRINCDERTLSYTFDLDTWQIMTLARARSP